MLAPHQRHRARDQFARAERLGEVVVGAALRPTTLSDSESFAVSMSSGVSVLAPASRNARHSVMPSRPGSITSRTIKSNRVERPTSNAACRLRLR